MQRGPRIRKFVQSNPVSRSYNNSWKKSCIVTTLSHKSGVNKLSFIGVYVLMLHKWSTAVCKCFLSANLNCEKWLRSLSFIHRLQWPAHAEVLDFFCISNTCFISWVVVASLCCSRSEWPLVTPQHSGVDIDGHLGRPEAGDRFSQ